MSKVIFEFNLPEDRNDYEIAHRANKLYCALWEIKYEVLRKRWKYKEYEHEETSKEIDDIYSEVCDCIDTLLDDIA